MLFFWLPGQKQQSSPKVNKLLSTEEIMCTTGFNKLPGLPQRSQIWIDIRFTGSTSAKMHSAEGYAKKMWQKWWKCAIWEIFFGILKCDSWEPLLFEIEFKFVCCNMQRCFYFKARWHSRFIHAFCIIVSYFKDLTKLQIRNKLWQSLKLFSNLNCPNFHFESVLLKFRSSKIISKFVLYPP